MKEFHNKPQCDHHRTLNDMTADSYLFFSKALAFLLIVNAADEETLTVSLYKVMKDGALIDWHFSPDHKNLKHCEFVYEAVSDKHHQQRSRLNISDKKSVDLCNLLYNVTYHFYMVCCDKKNITINSNKINFTTGPEPDEMVNYGGSSKPLKVSSGYSENPIPISLDIERTRSSNIILGAICGIIGFLIINVTVVLAVRKYSYWQIRRRRILETEDREYDGLEHLRDED